MRRRWLGLGPVVAGAMCIVLLACLVQPAAGMSPAAAPEEQPTLAVPEEDSGAGGAARDCTGLSGTVVNWGFRNEPGIKLDLAGGGYEASQISGNEGQYEFRGLGQGYAVLRPILPAAQAQSLHVYADQIAVPLTCGNADVVNVGVYSGDVLPQPPAYLVVQTAGAAEPGTTLTFTITVQNDLPTGISKVVVTDLLPDQLQYVDAKAAKGQMTIQDGRMVAWNIGKMADAEATDATLTVRVNTEASTGDLIANRVSLLYAEAIADQVLTTTSVGQGFSEELSLPEAAPEIAEAGESAPTVAAPEVQVPAVEPTPTASAAIELAPALPLLTGTLPIEGQPAKLPTTGAAGGAAMPLIGLGLVAVVLATRFLRRA